MGVRHRARERALQCLYQWESTASPIDRVLQRFWSSQPEAEEVKRFAEHLVRGTVAAIGEIDPLIERQAANWRLERMSMIDRNVLRLGVYELLHERETPPAVVIDEAIELAKRFSGDEAGHFVNGILDGLRRARTAEGGADGGASGEEAEVQP